MTSQQQPRDPFPMSSPEAQRLAASVEGQPIGENDRKGAAAGKSWNSMVTKSENRGPLYDDHDDDAGRQGLVPGGPGGANKKGKGDAAGEDYEDDDDDRNNKAAGEDAFLDRPLWESRGTANERRMAASLRFLNKLYRRLYGEKLPPSEMLRTLCLALTLFFMIGGYWLLRSLKDPVLTALCGVQVIPKAKMLSVFVVLAVVSIYNHFLDSDIARHKLFYVFGSFYFLLFLAIAIMLMHPEYGLANQQQSPSRLLGWISYCGIESFGSVMVSLFWSFANSNFSLETAKASYGVMVATAQVGSILGPTVVSRYAETLGVARIYMIGALCMLLLQGTMYMYISLYGAAERNAASTDKEEDEAAAKPQEKKKKKKERAGILEGLRLFWEHNYVKGIFAISCLFMVEVTIVDYTMKVLARDYFAEEHPCEPGMSCWNTDTAGEHGMSEDATAAFTTFMGFFGQATNTLSFLLSLLGTSAVIRYLGLRLTLLLFPSLCLAVIIFVRLYPTLYVVFGAMMMLKACSYALNNPTKEMLYQPTAANVRYKAKSWIDIFGARGSKALGSLVTNAFSDSASRLVANGSLVGMAVASFLIWNATFMGKKFDEYTASGYVVGGSKHEDEVEADNVKSAMKQQDVPDTSCAVPYDDEETGPEEEGQEDGSGNEGGDDDDDKKPIVTRV